MSGAAEDPHRRDGGEPLLEADADLRLQRAIADACLGADSGEALEGDLRGFLERHGVEAQDVEAILAGPPRLAVYRSLIRNGLGSVVLRMLPRTREHLEATCPGRFEADLRAFAAERGPRTPYLRDVPSELVAWATPRWQSDPTVPAYLADLAAHELAHFAVAAAAAAISGSHAVELRLERPLLFAGSMRILRHAWAVHELPAEGALAPAARDVTLLAYRDEAHAVHWLELTPLAGEVVATLASGIPLGPAIERACAARGVAPAAVLPDIARLLADLGERGVLLGARA